MYPVVSGNGAIHPDRDEYPFEHPFRPVTSCVRHSHRILAAIAASASTAESVDTCRRRRRTTSRAATTGRRPSRRRPAAAPVPTAPLLIPNVTERAVATGNGRAL